MMMKKVFICSMFLGLFAVTAQAQDTLVYDAADGSITLNTDIPMSVYEILAGDDDIFDLGAHTPPAGFVDLSDPSFLGALADVPVAPGSYNIGNVLEAGLTSQEFEDAILLGAYDGGDFTLEYVPEPSSLALLAMGGLIALRRRRA